MTNWLFTLRRPIRQYSSPQSSRRSPWERRDCYCAAELRYQTPDDRAKPRTRRVGPLVGELEKLEMLRTPLASTIDKYARDWESNDNASRDLSGRLSCPGHHSQDSGRARAPDR